MKRQKPGSEVSFEPSVSDSEHLARELDLINHKRVLLLRTTIASDDLPAALEKRRAQVTDLRIYKTDLIREGDESFSRLLHAGKVDFITFASPSAVAGFVARASEASLRITRRLSVVAIGPSVAGALNDIGFVDVHTAQAASLDGVIQTLLQLAQ